MKYREYEREKITLEEAVLLMKETASKKEIQTEEAGLLDALGKIAAKDCISPISQPPFDRSPLDGYALRAEDTTGANKEHPAHFTVIGEVTAGNTPIKTVHSGEAYRIMTGAPIPQGANCIIRQEDTDYGENQVIIWQEMRAYENYCYAGEDFQKGEHLITAGTKIGATELGILASMGYSSVSVLKKPRIAVFSVGDELTAPGMPLEKGKIYNSNLYLICGRFMELGMQPAIAEILPDTSEKVAEKLCEVLPQVDFIVTTGGVSVGKKDIMHEVLSQIKAKKLFWKVNVKPGTPTIFAVADNVPIVALSGNPFGALTHFELLVRPLLADICRDSVLCPAKIKVKMQDTFPKGGGMRRMVRGYFENGSVSLPKGLHSSGILSTMRGCNCLIDIPAGSRGLFPGDEVSVWML